MNSQYERTRALALELSQHCTRSEPELTDELASDIVTFIEGWEPKSDPPSIDLGERDKFRNQPSIVTLYLGGGAQQSYDEFVQFEIQNETVAEKTAEELLAWEAATNEADSPNDYREYHLLDEDLLRNQMNAREGDE